MQLCTLGCNWQLGVWYTLGYAAQISLQGRVFCPAVGSAPFQVCLSCRAASLGGPHLVSDLMDIAAWPFQFNAEYSWATFTELSTGLAKALSRLPHSSTFFSAHSCFLSLPSNRNRTLITPLPQTLSQYLLLNSARFGSWLLLNSHVHMYMYMRFCSEIYLSPTWPWLV